jgi:peroxiredoxin
MIDALAADVRDRDEAPGLRVGDAAPDFVAPDAHGGTVRLSDHLSRGPVVLSFYRGAWCPICSVELRALRDVLPEIATARASLIAVSPQAPDTSLTLVESSQLGFAVCSDLDQTIAADYRVRFELRGPMREMYEQIGMPLSKENADGTWNLPVPATYVIDADGVVRAAFVDPDYRRRMEPGAIVEVLRGLPAP